MELVLTVFAVCSVAKAGRTISEQRLTVDVGTVAEKENRVVTCGKVNGFLEFRKCPYSAFSVQHWHVYLKEAKK
jgi:hypothetical protein